MNVPPVPASLLKQWVCQQAAVTPFPVYSLLAFLGGFFTDSEQQSLKLIWGKWRHSDLSNVMWHVNNRARKRSAESQAPALLGYMMLLTPDGLFPGRVGRDEPPPSLSQTNKKLNKAHQSKNRDLSLLVSMTMIPIKNKNLFFLYAY